MISIVNAIGYIGMVLLLLGIYLVRNPKRALHSDICILITDALLAVNCWFYGTIPVCIVNAIICILTVWNIKKDLKERSKWKKE